MKITSTGPNVAGPSAASTPAVQGSAPVRSASTVARADAGESQSASLQTAQAALQALPDIDEAKVAALREALARGEVHFDAGKLASLISRYHGGRE